MSQTENTVAGARAVPIDNRPGNNDPQPPAIPTQEGPYGIRYDFNQGARVLLPSGADWKVELKDLDSGVTVFLGETTGAMVVSTKKYYMRFGITVWRNGQEVFTHGYSARDRKVVLHFYIGTLGDLIAWFSAAPLFQQKHQCRLTCSMSGLLIPLFRDAYPEIEFLTPAQIRPQDYYAAYKIMIYFGDDERTWQPCEARYVGLHRTAAYMLGLEPVEHPPRLGLPDRSRPVPEPYVCIATQATSQAKYWNNPDGWREVIRFLKREAGYRVFCIDQKRVHGVGLNQNSMPEEAEDQTGDHPLTERARWLLHADFFVGLSSGLAWLAWAAQTPVVMISGFTHPTNEFATPYRVINYHVCNSCWNDPTQRFNPSDFLWCPRLAGTPRQFECTRLITPEQVTAMIRRVPAFQQSAKSWQGGNPGEDSMFMGKRKPRAS
jgi:autotransporter strand-loop-strand O-heptosyltransferase